MSKKRVLITALGAAAVGTGIVTPVNAAISPEGLENNSTISQRQFVGSPDLVLDFVLLAKSNGTDLTLQKMFSNMGPDQANKLPDFYTNLTTLGLVNDRTKLFWSLLEMLEASENISDETFKTVGARLVDLHSADGTASFRVAQVTIDKECDLDRPLDQIQEDPDCIPPVTGAIGGGTYST
ncbi:hypothetical protein [Hoeflea sp. TYP-13]|uniref:hypothetical protein n=1 Tax=Hoeflea sp. TYP-13 TaxID=3230023 RepID=UPI0034C66175